MNFLNFLREDSPWSMMRVATFLTIIMFVPAFVYQWAQISGAKQQLQEIPEGVMWLLGVLLSGKVIQKGIEIAGKILSKPQDTP